MPNIRIRKCCVPGCNDVVSRRHRFPKSNPILFERWIKIIKPNNWQNLTDDQIYNRYYVCHAHFSDAHSLPEFRRGLTVDAFPTINVSDDSFSFDQPKCSEAIIANEAISDSPVCFDQPTCSEAMQVTEAKAQEDDDDPNTAPGELLADVSENKPKIINPIGSHSILRKLNYTKISQLTERERILYTMLRKTNMRMSKLKRNNKILQERLASAKKLLQNDRFGKLTKYINPATSNFLTCQIRNKTVKLHARRYTEEEKKLALDLYKSSPKGYSLLNQICTLPSGRTLQRSVKKLPSAPGINNHIVTQLEDSVNKIEKRLDEV